MEPTVTDHYLGYVIAGVLKGPRREAAPDTVCYNTGGHIVEDSVVAYFDERNQRLSAWYRERRSSWRTPWPSGRWRTGRAGTT